MGIDHGRPHITMTQELLNGPDIVIRLKQMTGEAVTKRMRRRSFGDLCLENGALDRFLDMGFMQMITPRLP